MKKILVVGSINQDITLHMDKLPIPGETVIASDLKSSLGGKGANQAIAASRMGADVAFIGAIGKEKGADSIIDIFSNDNVLTKGIQRLKENTGTAYISIDKQAENNIIVYPGANFALTKEHLHLNKDLFEAADYCLIQLEIPIDIIKETIALSKEHNCKILLNPAPYNIGVDDYILSNIDYYIPNETEFLQTIQEDLNGNYDIEWFKEKGIQFANKYNLTLIITLGSQGALVIDDQCKLIPAHKTVPVDTTAAGDSFIGGFLAALANGVSQYDALDFGARVASLTISRYGAISAIPYKEEIV